jgi:hypothetical protein
VGFDASFYKERNVANAYDIAITISCENSVSPVLAIIAKDMLGLTGSAKQLEQAFNRIGTGLKLAVGGAAGIMAGIGIEKGLLSIARAGEDLLHQQNIMIRNGLSHYEVANLTADAYERIAKAVPTAAASDILRTISELRTVVGTERAEKEAPFALKLDAIIGNITGKDSEGAGFALWRALEMKGITMSDPAGAEKLASTMAQIIGASGGKVTADSYRAFAQRGAAAWITASPHLIGGAGSVLIGDMSGDTAGTAYSTFYNSVMGAAQMSRQQIDAYRQAGLVDESKVRKIKGSSNVQMDPGAIKGVLEYSHDLDQWVANVMAPSFHEAAKKIAAKSGVSEDAAYDALLGKAGRNKSTQRLFHMWGDPEFLTQIEKDREIWAQAQGLDVAYGTLLGDPSNKARGPSGRMSEAADAADSGKSAGDYLAVMKALEAQWKSFMEAVGGPVAQALIPQLKAITESLTNMASWANAHSDQVKTMAKVMEDLGAGIAALGAIALGAGVVALVGPAGVIIGLSVALGALIHTFEGHNIAVMAQAASNAGRIHERTGQFHLADCCAPAPARVIERPR